jgi:hypothetical protein
MESKITVQRSEKKHAEKAYLVTREFIFDQGSSWKKNQKLVTSSTT